MGAGSGLVPLKHFEGLKLNVQQEAFVLAYCSPDINYNATRAYLRAYNMDEIDGYLTAKANASKLLSNANIQKAIYVERMRKLSEHDDLARRVMGEWEKAAFTDLTETYEIVGPVIRWQDHVPAHMRSLVKGVEQTATGVRIRFHDKEKALENLGKALGLFVEVKRNVGESYESLLEKLTREENEALLEKQKQLEEKK